MADAKLPARRAAHPPSVLGTIGRPSDLTGGRHWFGFERDVLDRNRKVVDNSAAYLDARRRQSDAYTALIEARMRIARKIAELADLPNLINDEQRQREHARWLAERRRDLERLQALTDHKLAAARNDAELARLLESGVRAHRNHEAAQRVKDIEIDRWYAEAHARASNAQAEQQDAEVDLGRVPAAEQSAPGDSAQRQRAADLAVLDHEIDLERQRGNETAVLALMNLRARLQAAS